MALVQMPNGEYVDIADGASPDVIAKIKSQYKAAPVQPRKERVAAGQPRTQAQQRADATQAMTKQGIYAIPYVGGALRTVFHDIPEAGMRAIPFADRAAAGLTGLFKGAQQVGRNLAGDNSGKGFGDGFSEGYNDQLATSREIERRDEERAPFSSLVGETIGTVALPIGKGERLLKLGARGARAAGMTRTEALATRLAKSTSTKGTLAKSAIVGGELGALEAASKSEDLKDAPDNALVGSVLGAGGGAAFGGALHLGTRGAQIIKDLGKGAADRMAHLRIGTFLDKQGKTPQQVREDILDTAKLGGDAKVGDTLTSLGRQEAALSRDPLLQGSEDLIQNARDRINNRGNLFADALEQHSGVPKANMDALARGDVIVGSRKAAGQRDYGDGGALDKITWTPKMYDFMRGLSERARGAFNRTVENMMARKEVPSSLLEIGPDGELKTIPSMRAFDAFKRDLDAQITSLYKNGNTADASHLSQTLRTMKNLIGEANHDYGKVLATQRDFFEREKALDFGRSIINGLRKDPRVTLKQLKGLKDNEAMDARIGVLHALIGLDKSPDPVAAFDRLVQNDAQHKVFEWAFGSRQKYQKFLDFIAKERRATSIDKMIAPGYQSITSDIAMANAANPNDTLQDIAMQGGKGLAFGGRVGLLTGVLRAFGKAARHTPEYAQEELAKILMSKGENLERGVREAKEFVQRRRRSNLGRALTAAKAGTVIPSTLAGEGQK